MTISTIRDGGDKDLPSSFHRKRSPLALRAPACGLLPCLAMRVLEARFYPRRRRQPDFIMVGYLVWKDERRRGRPVFEPARPPVPGPVLSKLRYLVEMNEPGSFERLQTLRSEFWSFVPVPAEARLDRTYSDVS